MWICNFVFVSKARVFCHECLFLSFQSYIFQSPEIRCHSYRGLSPITMSRRCGSLYPLDAFQPSNPAAQWDSHCPRAHWTSGAVVGFGYFRLQPKSSMGFLVLETSPSSKRGKSRWGAAPEVTLNLLSPCDSMFSTAPFSLLTRAGVDFPGFEGPSFPAVLTFHLLSSQGVTGRACPCSGQCWAVLSLRVKAPPGPPHHAAEFGCLGKVSPVPQLTNTTQSLSKLVMGSSSLWSLHVQNFQGIAVGELWPLGFGACSPAQWAVFTHPSHRCRAVSGLVPPGCPEWLFGRHRAVWHCQGACGHVWPLGAQRMLCPCAGCAVAMAIACTVARQLKHPRLHTAMPRNAQLSSFPSPFCDLADMTPLALIPLHSVALLRFLGVNPANPKKPAWHCKWGLWQWVQGWRS